MASSVPPVHPSAVDGALVPVVTETLLPADVGHMVRGTGVRPTPEDAIEALLARVADAFRASRASGFEHGFLAYAPTQHDAPLVPEADSVGTEDEILWHWHARESTVALSFHTHPGRDALCIPSGMDLVGALIRGDHMVYVMTLDGRLSGWRFRDATGHPRAVDDALRALAKSRKLDHSLVDFLYESFDAMLPRIAKPVYAARVTLDPMGAEGYRLERVKLGASFFSREELDRGARVTRARRS